MMKAANKKIILKINLRKKRKLSEEIQLKMNTVI